MKYEFLLYSKYLFFIFGFHIQHNVLKTVFTHKALYKCACKELKPLSIFSWVYLFVWLSSISHLPTSIYLSSICWLTNLSLLSWDGISLCCKNDISISWDKVILSQLAELLELLVLTLVSAPQICLNTGQLYKLETSNCHSTVVRTHIHYHSQVTITFSF